MTRENETMRNYILSVMVNNHFGVLTRISGLFARRGYNIKSLTVGETQDERISRMTIEFYGDEHTNEQIQNQLRKVVDVVSVTELRRDSSVCRELYLLKVRATDKTRAALVQIADIFRAKTVDVASDSLIFEIAGDEEKLKAFYSNMKKYGVLEVARTGVTAMARGRIDGDAGRRFSSVPEIYSREALSAMLSDVELRRIDVETIFWQARGKKTYAACAESKTTRGGQLPAAVDVLRAAKQTGVRTCSERLSALFGVVLICEQMCKSLKGMAFRTTATIRHLGKTVDPQFGGRLSA